jgi:hypothetical protein
MLKLILDLLCLNPCKIKPIRILYYKVTVSVYKKTGKESSDEISN